MKLNKSSTRQSFPTVLLLVLLCVSTSKSLAFTDPARSSENSASTTILFDLDEGEPDTPTQVKKLVEQLKNQFGDQELNIKITGRTCDLGDEQYNRKLSEKRAFVVMEMMMMKGLNINYIEIEAVGEEQPIVPNDSESNRKLNRSVMVYVQAGGLDQFLAAL